MRRCFLSLPSGEMVHYRVGGEGETIILLHGFGIDSIIWSRVSPLLQKNFRVLLVDFPGYGLNTSLWEGDMSVFSSFFNALFSAEKGALVVGYSFGGNALMKHLLKKGSIFPERVIFLSTPVRRGFLSFLFSLILVLFSFSVGASRWLVLFLTSPKIRTYLLKKTSFIPLNNKVIIEFCVGSLVAFKNPSFLCKSLSHIFIPTTGATNSDLYAVGVFGERDGFVKQKTDGYFLNCLFPNYRTCTIPKTHHLSPLENPTGVVDIITETLEGFKK